MSGELNVMAGAILSRSLMIGSGSGDVARERERGAAGETEAAPVPILGPPRKLCSLWQKPHATRSGLPSESTTTMVWVRSVLQARQWSSIDPPGR